MLCCRPIFPFQIANPRKLFGVMRNQNCIRRQRVRRNPQIIIANHRALFSSCFLFTILYNIATKFIIALFSTH